MLVVSYWWALAAFLCDPLYKTVNGWKRNCHSLFLEKLNLVKCGLIYLYCLELIGEESRGILNLVISTKLEQDLLIDNLLVGNIAVLCQGS